MKLKKSLVGLLLVLLVTLSKEGHSQSKPSERQVSYHILFVGNSLTVTNNLPLLMVEGAKNNGIQLQVEVLAYPNYAIEDHWNDGQLQNLVASKKFDFVILQQGPSSQADGRRMLLDYGAKIKVHCDRHNTRLAYFMVWPAKQNYHMFDGVIRNYSDAARINGAVLCPVGMVWKEYIESSGDFSYYGDDGFHPSLAGSKSAAEVICRSLFL